MSGIAGALYVPQVGIINPGEMSPANSIEIAIWAAVGGRGTLFGPILGAFAVNGAKTWFTVAYPGTLALFPWPAVRAGDAAAAARVDGAARHRCGCAAARRAARRLSAAKRRRRARERSGRPRAVGCGDVSGYGHVLKPDQVDTSHGPILYLEDITVSFDGFKALNNLSLTIDRGELRCIIGPNGAGKTTMMDVITGKTRPDAGTAFFGQTFDLARLPETEIARLGIGRKFQKPTVFENHTVFENLELAMKTDKRVQADAARGTQPGAAGTHRAHAQDDPSRRQRTAPRRLAVARSEAVARDRNAAGAGARTDPARRARRRHDRRRDRPYGRTDPASSKAAIRSWSSSTTWISSTASRAR